MEIAIAAFIGCWLTFFAVWAFVKVKKDYKEAGVTEENDRSGENDR